MTRLLVPVTLSIQNPSEQSYSQNKNSNVHAENNIFSPMQFAMCGVGQPDVYDDWKDQHL